jgi:cobalamin biosynthesis protein CobT
MGKRILNRKELRADFDAAARRKGDDEEVVDEEAGEDEEEEVEAEEKAEGDEEEEGAAAGEEDEEEAVVAPVKKKKAPKVAKPKSRARTAKVTRLRVVWGVFNNSHQCVATYEYPKRADADAHAAKLMADKKTTHFVQPVKEPIEEKKEKA